MQSETKQLKTNFAPYVILFVSSLLLFLYQINYYPPIFTSVLIIVLVFFYVYAKLTKKYIGILVFLYVPNIVLHNYPNLRL